MKEKIPVAVVGFGSQGRRTAEAIARQNDMKLLGVALSQPDLSAHLAFTIGYPIFSMEPQSTLAFKNAGVPCKGSIETIMPNLKALVDCTPAGVGKQNKDRYYRKHDLKVVFQAGEDPTIAEIPAFFSLTDYEKARRAKFVRIASPFAVSIGRTLCVLQQQCGIKMIQCTLVRAGSETMRAHQGPVDTIIPELPANLQRIKSELKQIFDELEEILLSSVKVPSILFDVQSIFFELTEKLRLNTIANLLTKTSRMSIVSSQAGLFSTDTLFEFIRRTRPYSADMYEVCVWKEQMEVHKNKLRLTQAVDPHSVHIPEVIDAIRAMTTQMSRNESMRLTDQSLGILKAGFKV
jgi:glyceraldehyde-3-phosphate dehydrogenase (NAD(P))